MSYTILQVRKGKEQSIFRKHPWIFSGALFTDTKEIEDGEIVALGRKSARALDRVFAVAQRLNGIGIEQAESAKKD